MSPNVSSFSQLDPAKKLDLAPHWFGGTQARIAKHLDLNGESRLVVQPSRIDHASGLVGPLRGSQPQAGPLPWYAPQPVVTPHELVALTSSALSSGDQILPVLPPFGSEMGDVRVEPVPCPCSIPKGIELSYPATIESSLRAYRTVTLTIPGPPGGKFGFDCGVCTATVTFLLLNAAGKPKTDGGLPIPPISASGPITGVGMDEIPVSHILSGNSLLPGDCIAIIATIRCISISGQVCVATLYGFIDVIDDGLRAPVPPSSRTSSCKCDIAIRCPAFLSASKKSETIRIVRAFNFSCSEPCSMFVEFDVREASGRRVRVPDPTDPLGMRPRSYSPTISWDFSANSEGSLEIKTKDYALAGLMKPGYFVVISAGIVCVDNNGRCFGFDSCAIPVRE